MMGQSDNMMGQHDGIIDPFLNNMMGQSDTPWDCHDDQWVVVEVGVCLGRQSGSPGHGMGRKP